MGGKDNGGWIRHRGWSQPVHDDVIVEYRMRSGRICKAPAGDLDWGHNDHATDIMAWIPHKAEQQIEPAVVANVDAFNAQAEMPASKQDGPLQWRDRILELDAEQKAADEARDAERAELVEKLRAEGLALIQAEDMSDPAKLEAGDLLKVVKEKYGHAFKIGEIVRVVSTNLDYKDTPIKCEHRDGSYFWFVSPDEVKWHSRPAK